MYCHSFIHIIKNLQKYYIPLLHYQLIPVQQNETKGGKVATGSLSVPSLWLHFHLSQGGDVDLVGTIGQTEDTSPGEEMREGGGARETHGTMSLRWREREREGGGEGGRERCSKPHDPSNLSNSPASLYPRPSEQLVGPPPLSWQSPSSPPVSSRNKAQNLTHTHTTAVTKKTK